MKQLINTAMGKTTANLVLKGGNVINVFTGKIELADIAISKGKICGIGEYNGEEEIDCVGKFIMPSFIDSHMHIESTQLIPSELGKLIIPHGTTCIISDPHEIANVCGISGVEYLYNECRELPLDAHFMLPSCVPATPFEDAGAIIDSNMVKKHIANPMFFGMGEYMNYPGVINCAAEDIFKLQYAQAVGKIVDGHACNVTGNALNAYLCGGIKTDHECITPEEMTEKIARGMYIQVRQGSSTRNLVDLIPAINATTMRRCLMCTDDKRVDDLMHLGHIDNNIRIAIQSGLKPIWAITMATLNPAECYGLKGKGAIAPSYDADIAVVDSLTDFNVEMVFKGGKLVAKDGKALFKTAQKITGNVLSTVNFKPLTFNDLKIKLSTDKAVVISLVPKNVVTLKHIETVGVEGGCFDYKTSPGINKLVVVERHKATGKIGLGLLKDYNIKNGAIAISIAHDSHNIIAVGDNDNDILSAINYIKQIGGGMVISSGGDIVDALPLNIAGLMTSAPYKEVEAISGRLIKKAHELGVSTNVEPFMCLSFLSLAVIPSVKITARGLFDVDKFDFIDIDPVKNNNFNF